MCRGLILVAYRMLFSHHRQQTLQLDRQSFLKLLHVAGHRHVCREIEQKVYVVIHDNIGVQSSVRSAALGADEVDHLVLHFISSECMDKV